MKNKMMRGCGESLRVKDSDKCPDMEKHDYEVGIEPKPSHTPYHKGGTHTYDCLNNGNSGHCECEAQTKAKHTPTPWSLGNGRTRQMYGSDDIMIADCDTEGAKRLDEERGNAAYIVKCVNSYEENQAELRALREALETEHIRFNDAHEEWVRALKVAKERLADHGTILSVVNETLFRAEGK